MIVPARAHLRAFIPLAITLAALLVPVQSAFAADSVYWSTGTAIRTGNLDGSGGASDLFPGESGPKGVAIDPATGKIYWATGNAGPVRLGNLDGSGASTLFTEPTASGLRGVAVDPAAGKIYWAAFGKGTIRVANLDGTGAPANLFEGQASVYGLAIDPAAGKVYWSSTGSDTIWVGSLDGSGTPVSLFTGENNPSGLAIDPAAGKTYWAAGETIRVANLDGSGTATTLFTEPAGSLPIAVAVDPDAGRIYWSETGTPAIRVANLDGSGTPSSLFTEPGGTAPSFLSLLRSPAGAGAPVISGAAGIGQQLSCSQGTWAPDLLGSQLFRAPASFAFQWQRDGADLAGETTETFTPTELGEYTCRVTATNHAGSSSQTSAALVLSEPTVPSEPTVSSQPATSDQPATTDQPATPSQPDRPTTTGSPQPKAPKHHKHPKHQHKAAPRLAIDLTASAVQARPSSVVGYRITVSNPGGAAARNVMVCDEPAAGQQALRTMPTAAGSKGRPCWHLASLAAGAKRVFRLTAMVAADSGSGLQRNSADVRAANVEAAPTDSATVRVSPLPESACGSSLVLPHGSRLALPELMTRTDYRC